MSAITVATQKGGAGKTLLCQVLASVLSADMRIVAIDADPTGALSRWAGRAYEGAAFETIAETDETRLAHLIHAKGNTADLVLVGEADATEASALLPLSRPLLSVPGETYPSGWS
jgi:cellulose biosynthesis protein BcsQ